jgi:hypothetical protein
MPKGAEEMRPVRQARILPRAEGQNGTTDYLRRDSPRFKDLAAKARELYEKRYPD